MDNLILSDEILNQQICSECLNYLSVGPVMLTREGHVLCGHCSNNKRIKLTCLIDSLYNLLAEKLVFRCINYYGGCEELLLFNEAKEHGKTCQRNKLTCPFCYFKCNGCQLVQHFNREHSEYVVKEDIFKINLKEIFSKNIVIVKRSTIFWLIVSKQDEMIEFCNFLVTPAYLGPEQFRLRFFNPGTSVEFVTAPIRIISELDLPSIKYLVTNIDGNNNYNQAKNSFLLDQTSLLDYFPSGWCLCKIELIDNNNCDTQEKLTKLNYMEKITKEINPNLQMRFNTDTNMLEANMRDLNEDNFSISRVLQMSPSDLRQFVKTELYLLQTCVNCNTYISTPVFFCPKYHMSCQKCLSSKCNKCRTCCRWSVKPKLNISLPCEWKGCCSCPNIFHYMKHTRDCIFRKYSCPERNCQFEGFGRYLKSHWHSNSLFEYAELNLVCKTQSIFWRNNYSELFYICMEYKGYRELSVAIEEVDVIMSKRYQFVVRYSVRNGLGFKQMHHTMCPNKGTKQFDKFHATHIAREGPLKVSCTFK